MFSHSENTMRLTPELKITHQLSTFVNNRQELLITNARFVGSREFCALEKFSKRVLSQVNHLTQALSLTEQEQALARDITDAVAALSR